MTSKNSKVMSGVTLIGGINSSWDLALQVFLNFMGLGLGASAKYPRYLNKAI